MRTFLLLLGLTPAVCLAASYDGIDRRLDELDRKRQSMVVELERLKGLQARYTDAFDPSPVFAERDPLWETLVSELNQFDQEIDDVDDERRKAAFASMVAMNVQVLGGRRELPGGGKDVLPYQQTTGHYDDLHRWRQEARQQLDRERRSCEQVREVWRGRLLMLKLLGSLALLAVVGAIPAVLVWRRRRAELTGYLPGAVVARQYRVVSRTGDQPLGPLYEAEDIELHRPVWLQSFHPDILDDRERLEQVAEGMRVAARLRHPSILQIFTVALEKERAALILERGPAASLADWLDRGTRLSAPAAARLFAQAAEALAYAHAQGVVHGGLEPGSMLIGQDGAVKLKDFVYGRLARKGRRTEPSPAEDVQALAELFGRTVGASPAGLESCSSARALAEALRRI